MIKFRKGTIEVKLLDTFIIIMSNNKRNVFNMLYAEDIETMQEIEKNLKGYKDNFKFKMSFNDKKDILKIVLNGIVYSLNAILI